ncbi:MAG: hypothetical protein PF488_01020 [Patescibacteria group bacterium]|jgi:enolase|nr:hypothetical protein [Patescibacteria group bacterium]
MKNKNLVKGGLIFSAFALVALGVISVQAEAASEDNLFKSFRRGGDEMSQQLRQGEGMNFQNLSEEEKLKFEEERELRREEAGTRRAEMGEKRELIEKAVENNDYQSWKSLVPEDCPMIEEINEENFSELKDNIGQHMGRIKNMENGFEGRGRHRMLINSEK